MSPTPDDAPLPSDATAVFTGKKAPPPPADTPDPASAMAQTLAPSAPPPADAATLDGACLAENPPPLPRRPIPGYEVLGVLGRGGMGVVYKAHQSKLNRIVALKMVLAGDFASPEACVRFLTEAETVARLHHPNIIQVYDFGSHEGVPYFTLEYLEGGALDRRLTGTPWSAKEAARTIETLARAVGHAHRHGVIHRDLKPGNVLAGEDGVLKITDFGLAKRVEGGSGVTQSGSIVGTPSYMAPEQAQGHNKNVGPAADIYALGAILYELLTGRPPFRAETPVDTIMHLLTEEAVVPTRLNPKCPRDLEIICLKCLQKEPSKRYATAEALADDLKRYQDGEPIQARPTPWHERAIRWAKRRPAVASVLAVCVLAGSVFLAYGWWYNLQLKNALGLADRERREAEAARALADSQRQAAEDEKRKVQDNLAKRSEIIDTFLDHVDGRLANKRGAESVRLEFLTEVEKLSRQLLEDQPDDPAARRQAGRIYRGLGELWERGAKSEQALRRAAEFQEKLVNDFPENIDYRNDLTLTRSRQGRLHAAARRYDAALKAYTQAIEIQDDLRRRLPEAEDPLRRAGYYRWQKANVLEEMEQLEQAVPLYTEAVDLYEELTKKYPQNASYQEDLAGVALSLGLALEGTDLSGAQKWLERSLVAARTSHELQGGRSSGRALTLAYGDLHDFQKRHGQHADLAALARRYREDFPGKGTETYNAACYLGNAVRAVRDNTEVPEAERKALADKYAAEAVGLLQKAAEEGYTDRVHMANDTDLDPLRDRADFQQFWADLEKRFPTKRVTPDKLLANLRSVHEGAADVFLELEAEARTAAEKKRAKWNRPSLEDATKRVFDIAEKNPDLPASLDALVWALDRVGKADGRNAPKEDRRVLRTVQTKALALIEKDHLAKKNLGSACKVLAQAQSPTADRLLRIVAEGKNPEPDVRALAAYYFASSLARQAQQALERGDSKGDELARQAEKQFEEVIKVHGAVTFNDMPLADYARRPLEELRTLSPGRPARSIEGVDVVDGKPMKLSDHTGQVVLIDFWADWCGFCRQSHPMQIQLVEKMKGRPFVVFGVNGDGDRESAKRGVQRFKLPWRSLWDGDSKVRDEWQVDGYPRFILLDHTGLIRKKWEGLPEPGEIDREVEKLVAVAEKAKKR